jgi:tagatose-1,6-bisphosphate aldolase non-catalytic subunit AgaZ/GatZ
VLANKNRKATPVNKENLPGKIAEAKDKINYYWLRRRSNHTMARNTDTYQDEAVPKSVKQWMDRLKELEKLA